jgi:hypothetical protein
MERGAWRLSCLLRLFLRVLDHGGFHTVISERGRAIWGNIPQGGETPLVLDPFVGGGSVTAAALMLRRRSIGNDINQKHIETTRRGGEEVL